MQLEDWLDDLCVRFIVNLPPEELGSVERICFQVEEAQWFYEDFIRPLDPSLPSLSLKTFSLRIFQHCPLFSTWTTQHYTSAFAEFLAYKQRVPVRGAIMLNEDMDEVVLVKGWKKGANWSFPRGKINKDENDLDCAIREVYEETGFDIQSAGLVKPEKDMKYIEVTMREQHMRLYVFRGVPRDTYFEPKTRKEISKVEWYKLTDLPTLKKKHAHNDAQDEGHALNANKFYMVAPFLHPLKKWIAQQKKKENRYSSSHLAAPPMTFDESATEGEPGPATHTSNRQVMLSPSGLSSLPEVASIQTQYPIQDPSSHLKELLKIGTVPQSIPPIAQPLHALGTDADKSNALLALLRNGSTAEIGGPSSTASEQVTFPPQVPQSAPRFDVHTIPSVDNRQPPPTSTSSINQAPLPVQQRSLLDLFSKAGVPQQKLATVVPPVPESAKLPLQDPVQQPLAPYQRTGDPQFARGSPEDTRAQVIPPAAALPKLTHHTRTLLDAFKAASVAPSPAPSPLPIQTAAPAAQPVQKISQPPLAPGRQALLDAFKISRPQSQPRPDTTQMNDRSEPAPTLTAVKTPSQQPSMQESPHPKTQAQSSNASSLLSLFKPQGEKSVVQSPRQAGVLQAPVELAAGPLASPKPQQSTTQAELLSVLMRKDAPKKVPQATKAGETAATLEGPLNQPHFEGIIPTPSQISAASMHRSPVPTHRTLYDPKQPAPTKILHRGEENRRNQAKSPRPPKASMTAASTASPKQKTRSKPEKPFQPQILKRPQIQEEQPAITSSPTSIAVPDDLRKQPSPLPFSKAASPLPSKTSAAAPPLPADATRRTPHQSDSQKQNLLSLLTGMDKGSNNIQNAKEMPPPSAVSPLTQSQVVSPLSEEPPISTRSRMGSLASITSAGLSNEARPKIEKRQTTAGDKAFLLGYLGRIASQGGQAQ